MSQLSASPASEPRHTRGGAGGAGRGQWVKYPLRVVLDADAYAPGDTNFYGKVKALSARGLATASMEKIASFLGVSKSTGERAARRLGRPAPTDGVQELFTKRQTHKVTGTGQTAQRWCRALEPRELFVWGPVLAADTLRGILHRLYLAVRYTVLVKGHQPTLAELARLLRHFSGKRAGQPLTEAAVSRLLDELEALGWITLKRRAGYRGRHLITVHDDPVHLADEDESTPDPDDGSGPDLGDGSLAYKEDQGLNDLRSTQERGPFRRRRDDRKWVASTVDTVGNAADDQPATEPDSGEAPTAPCTPPARPQCAPERPAYTGPEQTLSRRVWAVLEPVRDLLPGVTPFMVRRIAREIGSQLDTGVLAEDITAQLRLLRGWTDKIHDPAAWILGAALPTRPGPCGMTDCIRGFARHTGAPCKACADLPPGYRSGYPPHTRPAAAALLDCPGCHAPYRPPLRHPDCRLCGTQLPTAT
ncbi:hypothetical protein ACWEQ7_02885 [Streptomyces sp. NPDC004069]